MFVVVPFSGVLILEERRVVLQLSVLFVEQLSVHKATVVRQNQTDEWLEPRSLTAES